MWDLFKTLAKWALIGLAIRLGMDIYAELRKPKDEHSHSEPRSEGQT